MSDEDRGKLDAYFERMMTRDGILGQIHLFTNRIKHDRLCAKHYDLDEYGNTYASRIAGNERQLAYWRRRLEEIDGADTEKSIDPA